MATGDYHGELREVDHILETGPGLRALRAMVDTLADGAPPELVGALLAQLPDRLKGAASSENAEAPASLGEFLDRFQQRAGLPGQGILHRAQIAVRMLGEMLPEETMDDLRFSFPEEFWTLFDHHHQR